MRLAICRWKASMHRTISVGQDSYATLTQVRFPDGLYGQTARTLLSGPGGYPSRSDGRSGTDQALGVAVPLK
jgi:hypothetical protein